MSSTIFFDFLDPRLRGGHIALGDFTNKLPVEKLFFVEFFLALRIRMQFDVIPAKAGIYKKNTLIMNSFLIFWTPNLRGGHIILSNFTNKSPVGITVSLYFS
jgi:hypothetical protein